MAVADGGAPRNTASSSMAAASACTVSPVVPGADPQDTLFGFEFAQHFSDAGIAVACEMLGDLPWRGHTQGAQSPLGGSTDHLVLGKWLLCDPARWQAAFCQIPPLVCAHTLADQDVPLGPEEVEHPAHRAAIGPARGSPSHLDRIFEVPGTQGATLLQRAEDGEAQRLILLHPGADVLRPGVGPLAVGTHPHLMDVVILRQHNRSPMPPVFEESTLLPDQDVQARF